MTGLPGVFETIRIVRSRRKSVHGAAVYDDDQLIHQGQRPVDLGFADCVQRQAVAAGYIPQESADGHITTFKKG